MCLVSEGPQQVVGYYLSRDKNPHQSFLDKSIESAVIILTFNTDLSNVIT